MTIYSWHPGFEFLLLFPHKQLMHKGITWPYSSPVGLDHSWSLGVDIRAASAQYPLAASINNSSLRCFTRCSKRFYDVTLSCSQHHFTGFKLCYSFVNTFRACVS